MSSGDASTGRRVTVVVLGDLGRSPRMANHAVSMADEGFFVDIVAYGGSRPKAEVSSSDRIGLHIMRDPPAFQKYLPRFLAYVVKVIWQTLVLTWTLLTVPRPTHVLVQNPPSVPTLPVAWFCCLVRGSDLVVDWHNYGWSLLALALGRRHLLVRLCAWCERTFGRKARASFCVSRGMQEDLEKNWKVYSEVLYDRPPKPFQPLDAAGKHAVLRRLSPDYPELADPANAPDRTRLTRADPSGTPELREDRPAVLVSATSWTEDEDFSLLLDALQEYDLAKQGGGDELPELLCIVTGKGPLKEHYLEDVQKRSLQHVRLTAPWLSAEDYPALLGTADLGLCLHTSSSKLDLPMKVVDMFGCGLPVCAVAYPCLEELIVPEKTGLLFTTGQELSRQLMDLFRGFPKEAESLDAMRKNVLQWQELRWETHWRRTALGTFQK